MARMSRVFCRWVELVVRMLETGLRKGCTEGAPAYAKQITWFVRTALQRPALDFERWKLDSAAAAQQVRQWGGPASQGVVTNTTSVRLGRQGGVCVCVMVMVCVW